MKYQFYSYAIGFVRKYIDDIYIELNKDFQIGGFYLENISHAFILWWMHKCDNKESRNVLKVIPNVKNAQKVCKEMGVFATRSPSRPNPIGLTLVKILSIENNRIYIDYIDAYNETPVLDIKPYLPNNDRVDEEIHLPSCYQELLSPRPANYKLGINFE